METIIEDIEYPGYFKIPNYPKYIISKDGKVFNKKTGLHLNGGVNPSGYTNIRITNEKGTLTWGLHRLLCYVFKHPKTNITDLVVNHKDGIKANNDLDNLEWVTYQGNAEHAGRFGLTSKCIPVSIRNIKTDIIYKFPSFLKCSQFLGVSKDTVNWRVKAGENRVFSDGYQYRIGTSDLEWAKPKISDLYNCIHSKAIVVKFLISNREIIYPKIKDYCDFSGMSSSTLTNWLNLPNHPVLPGLVQVKYLSDETPWRYVSDIYSELEAFSGERVIIVHNTITDEEEIFTSCIECCKKMSIRPNALNYRLKSNGKTVFRDGCRYKYFNTI